ncbi:ABC transporter ATP-binding protein [Paenibacillus sp. R14(2021)]|uniref:ABC transporter ATP-binding protein n=1 Tax=Paenibacillus sp. R14(2021) TaxID=2859228 RepID=UPI001C61537D|nr:dipeptide ABC transporter ATP-binding protein [Paenibacillus sp. R14(2021)]
MSVQESDLGHVAGREAEQDDVILNVQSLKKYFPIRKGFLQRTEGYVKAVDDVSFYIRQGETFGLVGESGCGKTTLGRCVLRAIEPTEGLMMFKDREGSVRDLNELDNKEMRKLRRDMQLIFQDPYSSLNPRMTVQNIVAEPLICNGLAHGDELRMRVRQLIELVGLNSRHMDRYPHAFSGGQRQRIGIARALATNPRFVVCDEAVSALDVSVQAQILNLLQDLQKQLSLSYLFISHDLGVIRHISDRVGVMYVGRMVETGSTEELFRRPRHPYTEALLSAKPVPDPRKKTERIILKGEVANPAKPPSGCYFHPRCPYAKEICAIQKPEWRRVGEDHFVACHFADELTLQGAKSL